VAQGNPDLLREAARDRRPLILCFLHLGNWEVLGEQMAHLWPGRIAAVVMPPANRAHAFIARRRRRHLPADLIEMDRHVWRAAAARLREPGGVLWLAADETHAGRVGAPFLGRPPVTDGNLGKMVRLAACTGARILPIYAERHPEARFTLHALPELTVLADRRDAAGMLEAVLHLDSLLEPVVRRLAEQWYMAIEFGQMH
jgi:lauroyl/myristoyl acyltransferase